MPGINMRGWLRNNGGRRQGTRAAHGSQKSGREKVWGLLGGHRIGVQGGSRTCSVYSALFLASLRL